MLQTAAEKMIFVIYLVILVFNSKYASGFTINATIQCKSCGNYQQLDVAEQIIKSVKEKISNNCQSPLPMDCEEILKSGERRSGVYVVWPKKRIISGSISVYCDMDTDGGGWTVIQRRGNFRRNKDFFYKNWQAYKKGFGNLREDFWLGNDKIYALSNQKVYSARFDLGDAYGNKRYAKYDRFWIDNEQNSYTLHNTGYNGNAGDSLAIHNGQKFSTKDRDNDKSSENCAQFYKGAWWYESCQTSNLNGEYMPGRHNKKGHGMNWNHWKGSYESLATTEIKIRKNRSWTQ